jgi:hypothetical protein
MQDPEFKPQYRPKTKRPYQAKFRPALFVITAQLVLNCSDENLEMNSEGVGAGGRNEPSLVCTYE